MAFTGGSGSVLVLKRPHSKQGGGAASAPGIAENENHEEEVFSSPEAIIDPDARSGSDPYRCP